MSQPKKQSVSDDQIEAFKRSTWIVDANFKHDDGHGLLIQDVLHTTKFLTGNHNPFRRTANYEGVRDIMPDSVNHPDKEARRWFGSRSHRLWLLRNGAL